MLSFRSFGITLDLGKLPACHYISRVAQSIGGDKKFDLRLGGLTLHVESGSVVVGSDTVSYNIPRSEWDTLKNSLFEISSRLLRDRVGYLSLLPNELRQRIFLFYPYDVIIRKCLDIPDLGGVYFDESFWKLKASHIGVSAEEFGVPEHPSYRYLELLTQRTELAYEGSDEFIDGDECAIRAAGMGRVDLFEHFIEMAEDPREASKVAITYAAREGKSDMVTYLIDRDIPSRYAAPIARHGDKKLVERILGEEPDFIDEVIKQAAIGGHVNIVDDLLAKSLNLRQIDICGTCISGITGRKTLANEIRELAGNPLIADAFLGYLMGGHVETAKQLIGCCPKISLDNFNREHWNSLLLDIVGEAPPKSLEYVISKGADDIAKAIRSAVSMPGLKYLIEKGLDSGISPNDMLLSLVESENFVESSRLSSLLDLINDIVKRGATNINKALLEVTSSGSVRAVKKIVELGANNMGQAIEILEAAEKLTKEEKKILKYLKSL